MTTTSFWKKPGLAKLLLVLGIAVLLFYILTLYVIKDVYEYPLIGAISEMAAFPMLLLLAGLPAALIMVTLRGAKAFRIYYIVALLFWLLTVTLLFLY